MKAVNSLRFGLAMMALASPLAPAMAVDCPFVRAVYAPVEDEEFGTITDYEMTHSLKTIQANQSRYVATIRAPAKGPAAKMRSYDFGFAFSNGYGRTSLVFAGESAKSAQFKPSKGEDYDAYPSSPILYFDEEMKTLSAAAAPEDKPTAPAYLLMPDIGSSFWYWQKSDRAFVPPGTMWKFKTCRAK